MTSPGPVLASDVPLRAQASAYPEPFASRMAGRRKQVLGDRFGLTNFGVNRATLAPGATSALRHWHAVQDEFVYVLSGHPTLITDAGETRLEPGMCVGFKGGVANGHHLINRTDEDAVYLEVGDRLPGDAGFYPDDDLNARKDAGGTWRFEHKDGRPYE